MIELSMQNEHIGKLPPIAGWQTPSDVLIGHHAIDTSRRCAAERVSVEGSGVLLAMR